MGGPPKVDWKEYEKETPVKESTVPDPTDTKEPKEEPKSEN